MNDDKALISGGAYMKMSHKSCEAHLAAGNAGSVIE